MEAIALPPSLMWSVINHVIHPTVNKLYTKLTAAVAVEIMVTRWKGYKVLVKCYLYFAVLCCTVKGITSDLLRHF